MVTGDDVRLAAGPAGVVGRGAREGSVEERLDGAAEAADVDDDGVRPSDGQIVEHGAEGPCGGGVEVREGEGLFLMEEAGGEVGGRHELQSTETVLPDVPTARGAAIPGFLLVVALPARAGLPPVGMNSCSRPTVHA